MIFNRLLKLKLMLMIILFANYSLSFADASEVCKDHLYEVEFSQDIPEFVKNLFEEHSSLIRLKNKKIYTFLGLVKRAKDDEKLFKRILKLYGYFDSEVSFDIEENTVNFFIDLGERYKIKKIELSENLSFFNIYDSLNIKEGEFLDGKKCILGQSIIQEVLSNNGYPMAFVDEPEGTIDQESKTITIKFNLKKGNLIIVKYAKITGLRRLNPDYIKNRVHICFNNIYKQKDIDKLRKKLLETGKFSSIAIEPKQDDHIEIKASELAPKLLSIGVKYSSSERYGGNISWSHENVFGSGEKFEASFHKNAKEALANIEYEVPDFLRPEQILKTSVLRLYEKKKAYFGTTYACSSSVERPLKEWLFISAGVKAEQSKLTRRLEVFKPSLVGIPMYLKGNWSDSFLDPTHGIRAVLNVTPYFGKMQTQSLANMHSSNGMTVFSGEVKGYIPLSEDEKKIIIANFLRSGLIFIKNLNILPPNKRFYLGGGDSVRAYGMQLLSPFDSANIPTGGRSFIEGGTEARFRFSKDFGGVVFIEGGSVMEDKLPSLQHKSILWGVGFGVRYFSKVGPIRFDIAFPMKRRSDSVGKRIDAPFQFYVSVGQAF